MHHLKAPLLLGILSVSLLVAGVLTLRLGSTTANATTGGTISIGGSPAPSGGVLSVPINTTAPTDPYTGANITLTWDPALLSFNNFDLTGSTLTTSALCLPSTYSGAGGVGELVSCSVTGPPIASAGTLVTFKLNVLAPGTGCSYLHLVTIGAPDNGGTTFGTYTIDQFSAPEVNALGADVGVNVATGAACAAPPTPTPSPTPTPTITPTPTNTVPPTSTVTPFGGVRTVTPTSTPPVSSTAGAPGGSTPAPGAGGAPPAGGGQPGAGARPPGPGGSPGGVILLPNTGSSGSPHAPLGFALIAAAALIAVGGGAALTWGRRRGGRA